MNSLEEFLRTVSPAYYPLVSYLLYHEILAAQQQQFSEANLAMEIRPGGTTPEQSQWLSLQEPSTIRSQSRLGSSLDPSASQQSLPDPVVESQNQIQDVKTNDEQTEPLDLTTKSASDRSSSSFPVPVLQSVTEAPETETDSEEDSQKFPLDLSVHGLGELSSASQNQNQADSTSQSGSHHSHSGGFVDLKIHEKIAQFQSEDKASNLKGFNCSVCLRTFSRPSSVARHMRMHSFEINSFKCDRNKCDQEFLSLEEFLHHIISHVGEKTYVFYCPWCPYSACQKDTITNHVIKVHGYEETAKRNCLRERKPRTNSMPSSVGTKRKLKKLKTSTKSSKSKRQ